MAENLFDRIGKALGIAKLSPTQTIGSNMLTSADLAGTVSGDVVILPGDPALNLQGTKRWNEFELMLRDFSIVAAGVRMFLNLMAGATWTVNPPEGLGGNAQALAQEYADQAYAAIYSMTNSWSQVVRKTAAFRFYGFAILEWTAKRNPDGTIGFLDIEHRPQRTIAKWIRDPSGTVEGVVQQVSGKPAATIPRSKIIYAVDDVLTDSPEGTGLFRHLYATTERLRVFLELERVGYETDLRGIPIARAPLGEEEQIVNNAGPADSDARKAASGRLSAKLRPLRDFLKYHLRNRETGLLLPSDTYNGRTADGSIAPSSVPKWALELLNGNSSGFEAMHNAIQRLNQEIARVLGCEHLLLGADGSGSLALARSKVSVFYLNVTSTLQDLVDIFDRDLVRPLAELNGWDEALWPEMNVNEVSDRDIDQVTAALRDMATAGATLMPDDPAIGEVRDMLGLSRPPEDGMAMDAALLGNKGLEASLNPPDPSAPGRSGTKGEESRMNRSPEDGPVAKRIRPSRTRLRKRSG